MQAPRLFAMPDPAFRVPEPYTPRYLELLEAGELDRRVEEALDELTPCRVCPRDCRVDRRGNAIGVCRVGRRARVASAFPHFGEEDVLRGTRGSGTVFFAGCNLACVFCQNWEISQRAAGEELGAAELADVFLWLQDQGVHNLNLVTPEHVVPQVLKALALAAKKGLSLPLVYNTSAYDGEKSLRLLDGVVDIYLPDFKFWKPESARRYLKAPDYPEVARRAIAEMHRQVGVLKLGADGLARRGVLLRHLVMPGFLDETREILAWVARELSPDTFVNVMGQYRPAFRVGPDRYPELNRRPYPEELAEAHAAAREAGLWRLAT